jgi:toxin CptA
MSRSHSSWKGSASCRLEWRPSRWIGAVVWILGLLGVVSLSGSALPTWAGAGLSVLVLGYAGWSARRYLRQPVRTLVIPGGMLVPMLDGVPLSRFSLHWRGPLAFAAWQDVQGAGGHLVWWPDTLSARQRRELRLAADQVGVSAVVAAVAP